MKIRLDEKILYLICFSGVFFCGFVLGYCLKTALG